MLGLQACTAWLLLQQAHGFDFPGNGSVLGDEIGPCLQERWDIPNTVSGVAKQHALVQLVGMRTMWYAVAGRRGRRLCWQEVLGQHVIVMRGVTMSFCL